jgi:hypothetical protein
MIPVRLKLTEPETVVAFVIGAGLTLIILAFGLASAQAATPNFDASRLNILMVVGGLLMVIGLFLWLVIVQPWKNFDDWSTPLYTGHDDHSSHDNVHDGPDAGDAAITTIPGITDKISAVLNSVGISTVAQLAAHPPADLERIIADSGLRASGRAAGWVAQAKSVSQGAPKAH